MDFESAANQPPYSIYKMTCHTRPLMTPCRTDLIGQNSCRPQPDRERMAFLSAPQTRWSMTPLLSPPTRWGVHGPLLRRTRPYAPWPLLRHPRPDRGSMTTSGMDTRIRGHDKRNVRATSVKRGATLRLRIVLCGTCQLLTSTWWCSTWMRVGRPRISSNTAMRLLDTL